MESQNKLLRTRDAQDGHSIKGWRSDSIKVTFDTAFPLQINILLTHSAQANREPGVSANERSVRRLFISSLPLLYLTLSH